MDEYEDGRKTGEVAQAYYGSENIHKTYLAILGRYFGSRREKECILESKSTEVVIYYFEIPLLDML